MAGHICSALAAPDHLGKGEQSQSDLVLGAPRGTEQLPELLLRGPQRGIRHVVHQRDDEWLPFLSSHGFISHHAERCLAHSAVTGDIAAPLRLPNADGALTCRGTAASSAPSRSIRISSMCSMPMLRRIISGVTPAFSCSAAFIWRCVVDAG